VAWDDDEQNKKLLGELRDAVGDGGRVLVFLGAGVSFGAARAGSRTLFDVGQWVTRLIQKPSKQAPPGRVWDEGSGGPPATMRVVDYDDGEPMPSWKQLISRMRRELGGLRAPHEQDELNRFFEDQDYLDCAELFRALVGEPVYFDFLRRQYGDETRAWPTPTHEALVALDLPVVFTTNYDTLIERAHVEAGVSLVTSAEETEFREHLATRPPRSLVKLHGTIQRPHTVVLTRSDYARSRVDRREMFASLRGDLMKTSFLFLGFSLSDPNVNIILDDVRVVLDGAIPISYSVQAGRNWVKEQYLGSLGTRTLWLDSWNDMPTVLHRINPKVAAR
jgi:hypothetical protein